MWPLSVSSSLASLYLSKEIEDLWVLFLSFEREERERLIFII